MQVPFAEDIKSNIPPPTPASNIGQILLNEQKKSRKLFISDKVQKESLISKGITGIQKQTEETSKLLKDMSKTLGLILVGALAFVAALKDFIPKSFSDSDGSYDGSFAGRFNEGKDKNAIIKNKIIAEAERQGVDPTLALALADQESAFNPKAKSPTGAIGIFQMTTKACEQVGIPKDDRLYDPDYNIKYGIQYLKWCLKHTKTTEEALFAWNSGIGNLQKAKKSKDDLGTWNSAKRVSKEKGFTTQVTPKISKYKNQLSSLPNSRYNESSNIKQPSKATGTKFGGYQLKDSSVEISEDMGKFLRRIEGNGVVTSGMERTFKGHKEGPNSHYSGKKIDVRADKEQWGISDEEVVQTAINFLRDPATKFIYIEFNPRHKKRAYNIQARIKQREPGLSRNRLGCIFPAGATDHLDIEVDFSKVNSSSLGTAPTNKTTQQYQTNKSNIKKSNKAKSSKKPATKSKISSSNKSSQSKLTLQPQTKLSTQNICQQPIPAKTNQC